MPDGSAKLGSRATGVPNGATAELVQAQVDRVLASPGFTASERHSRLLRHLVSMSLAGRGAEIKEYVLGVELFGRGDRFNPQTDAIVRTEVSRLRAKLKAYYSEDRRDDAVIIDLPNRTYVPVFTPREIPVMEAPPLPASDRRYRWWVWATLLAAGALFTYQFYGVVRSNTAALRAGVGDDLASVAVLPFVNSESDPALEQFADGLTTEVIETLGDIEGLRVVSRSSAFQFKGKQEDLKSVASKLNVGALLEGSVRKSGKYLHITARLVNADGYQYYSHVYQHEIQDALSVQREVAAHAANALRVSKTGREVARFTKSADAHEWYMRGLYHASRYTSSELKQAIDCYQRAIGFDRNYAPAYAGLAEVYITLALTNDAQPRETMQKAADAARTAVKVGDTFDHAHAALGSVLALYEWDWAGAEKEFRKALELDPDDSLILQQYAMRYLAPQSLLESALFELHLAQRVDPLSPQVKLNRGRAEYFKREPAQALNDIHSAMGLDPGLEAGPIALAEAYLQSSQPDEASKALTAGAGPAEDEARLAVLGRVYGLSRQPERARTVLQQLAELDQHSRHISGYYFSQVYLALGETELALGSLEKAAEERSPLIAYVKVAPQFDGLRSEPRFRAILKRIRLER